MEKTITTKTILEHAYIHRAKQKISCHSFPKHSHTYLYLCKHNENKRTIAVKTKNKNATESVVKKHTFLTNYSQKIWQNCDEIQFRNKIISKYKFCDRSKNQPSKSNTTLHFISSFKSKKFSIQNN